jgi:hypothetical protein
MTAPEPSRRSFFGHLAGITAAGTIVYGCADLSATEAAPIPAPHPDALLIAMVAEMKEIDRVTAEDDEALGEAMDVEFDQLRKKLEPFDIRWRSLRDAVVQVPARTQDGFLAKAQAIGSTAHASLDGKGMDSFDDELAWSLVQDILREAH